MQVWAVLTLWGAMFRLRAYIPLNFIFGLQWVVVASSLADLRIEDLQIVDESSIPTRLRQSNWFALFKGIARGKALAIPADKAPPSSVREAVKRLKASGDLPDNFVFTARKQDDGKIVSYVINSAGEPAKPKTVEASHERVLSSDQVKEFILGRPHDYEHTLSDIAIRFFGKPVSSRGKVSDYHRLRNAAEKARERIEQELHGKFTWELRPDGSKVYRFEKHGE
jgi:uncharacterized protein (DUF2249 family)